MAFAETYRQQSCAVDENGEGFCISSSSSLVDENGAWVLLLALIPIAVSAIVFARTSLGIDVPKGAAWSAAIVLLLACIITGFSVGLFFLPAALLCLAALTTDRR